MLCLKPIVDDGVGIGERCEEKRTYDVYIQYCRAYHMKIILSDDPDC